MRIRNIAWRAELEWLLTDDWMETVLISGVVHPVGLAVWSDPRVLTRHDDDWDWCLWLTICRIANNFLQMTFFRDDLAVVQFVAENSRTVRA